MARYAKTPTIFQMEATECGAASLSMIFAYFGKHLPLEQMRIETGVSRDGCNAGNLMRAAKRFGLDCHGYRREPEGLRRLTPPCIIHWNFNHFVVFEGFKGNYAYINDPAMGRRRLSFEELDDAFTGVVLTFAPTDAFVKEKKRSTLPRFIKGRTAGQGAVLGKLVFVGVLLVFPGLLLPVLSQVFLDDILLRGNSGWISALLLCMAGAILLQAGLTLYRDRVLARLQKKLVLLSAREFLSAMFRLPMSFFDQRYAGDLVSRVSNNANVSNFLAGDLAQTALNLFVAVFYLALLLVYSPALTAIAAGAVLVNVLIVKISSDQISNASSKLQLDSGKLAGTVCAGLGITATLKASGAENEYVSRVLGCSAKTVTTEQRLSRTQQIINAVPEAVKMLADVGILLAGGVFVIRGEMSVGMLAAFSALFGSFARPVEELVGFVKKIQSAKADIDRVEDILAYPADWRFTQEEASRGKARTKLEGSVELREVSFGYSRLKPPIVSDFSFRVPCGSSIAFVGASGCGKSTVSKVVSGLYAPWTGEVLLDGKNAGEIPGEVRSASIATVSQSLSFFSGSIRDNLTMWNGNIPESDMIAAAKDACIHDLISQKPGAYDFRLAEGAANLSGGQRQRLEIARALAANPTILIMDEATSALDPVVEKKILDNIKRRGCTCVIVAHRLSAIRDCDQILVMDGGRIVQRGTHEALSREEGPYQAFIQNL